MKVITDPNEIVTTHDLDFEVAPWELASMVPKLNLMRFRVGTCEGVWGVDKLCYYILAIENKSSGNGHLQDVFEWFEASCKRDKKDLKVLEVWNIGFKNHLIKKRGFTKSGKQDLIKRF
jgi:hypothetical protein